MSIKLIETKEVDGIVFKNYLLENKNGAKAEIVSYGARIHKLIMPDIKGNFLNVVAGFDNIEDYYLKENPYFNAVIGRIANRIKGASFVLNNQTYFLNKNEKENQLHGGFIGFDKTNWDGEIVEGKEEKLVLKHTFKDGEENYPGNLEVRVEYSLDDENSLNIEYFATTDKDTHCNLTNHAYFNLTGDFSKKVFDTYLKINSKFITGIDEDLVADGSVYDITNTALDFTLPKQIGKDIHDNNEFLKIAGGYDFNYILKGDGNYVAKAFDTSSGIVLKVYTDRPCVQLYTGNFLGGLKGREIYEDNSAFCLETQGYPNACNIKEFDTTVLKAGETYHSKTRYVFSTIL